MCFVQFSDTGRYYIIIVILIKKRIRRKKNLVEEVEGCQSQTYRTAVYSNSRVASHMSIAATKLLIDSYTGYRNLLLFFFYTEGNVKRTTWKVKMALPYIILSRHIYHLQKPTVLKWRANSNLGYSSHLKEWAETDERLLLMWPSAYCSTLYSCESSW